MYCKIFYKPSQTLQKHQIPGDIFQLSSYYKTSISKNNYDQINKILPNFYMNGLYPSSCVSQGD